ncbi:MAG: hypothetical protein AB7S26_29010 [Sandaracinaceae bacterium]
MSNTSVRQLVVAALLRHRDRTLTARETAAVLARAGHPVPLRDVALELERLYREGSARRGRDERRRAYQIVALPQKQPGTIARLNHLRRTWKQSDSCARKSAALRALRDELADLAQRPITNRSGADAERATQARNTRYRSELSNKARETRAFCQRANVGS